MRFKRAMTAVLGLVAVASVVTAAPGAAEGRDYQPVGAGKAAGIQRQEVSQGRRVTQGQPDFQAQTTGGNSFVEINADGNLVYWQRTGDGVSFYGQVRGWGWQNTRIVSTLTADSFVEVKGDGRLARWTWNGAHYSERIVGYGWQNARLLSGVSWNRFIEVNQAGNLVLWQFDGQNNLSAATIGQGWNGTRIITGLADLDFLEVKADGRLSEWISESGALQEYPFTGTDFSDVRLMAGLDVNHFLLIDGVDGGLYEFEFNPSDYTWYPTQRGYGWTGTQAIG